MSQTAHFCSPIGLFLKKKLYIQSTQIITIILRYQQTGFYNYETISYRITFKMDGDWRSRSDPNKLYAYKNMMQRNSLFCIITMH